MRANRIAIAKVSPCGVHEPARRRAAEHDRGRIERVDQDAVAAEARMAEIERVDALVIGGGAVEHVAHVGRDAPVDHGDGGRAADPAEDEERKHRGNALAHVRDADHDGRRKDRRRDQDRDRFAEGAGQHRDDGGRHGCRNHHHRRRHQRSALVNPDEGDQRDRRRQRKRDDDDDAGVEREPAG